jgi:hypothetical protein
MYLNDVIVPCAIGYLKKVCFLFFILLCYNHSTLAQDTSDSDINTNQGWVDMTLSKKLSERWSVGGDFGYRTSLNNNDFRQFYIRPNLNYKLSKIFNFTLGIGNFNTFSEDLFNIYEFRVYQDANLKWPKLGVFNFFHRLRFEERFFNYSATTLDADFIFRARYLLGFKTDNFSLTGQKNWSVFLSLEHFFRLAQDSSEFLANNFRWDSALCYQATTELRIELHYILQTSQLFRFGNSRVVDNIFCLRFFSSL